MFGRSANRPPPHPAGSLYLGLIPHNLWGNYCQLLPWAASGAALYRKPMSVSDAKAPAPIAIAMPAMIAAHPTRVIRS